jgi:hypothetical protein
MLAPADAARVAVERAGWPQWRQARGHQPRTVVISTNSISPESSETHFILRHPVLLLTCSSMTHFGKLPSEAFMQIYNASRPRAAIDMPAFPAGIGAAAAGEGGHWAFTPPAGLYLERGGNRAPGFPSLKRGGKPDPDFRDVPPTSACSRRLFCSTAATQPGYQLALSGQGPHPHMSDVDDIIDREASPGDAARVAAMVASDRPVR